jgi:hypothetical protein
MAVICATGLGTWTISGWTSPKNFSMSAGSIHGSTMTEPQDLQAMSRYPFFSPMGYSEKGIRHIGQSFGCSVMLV